MSNEIIYIDPLSEPVGPYMRFKYVAAGITEVQAALTTSLTGSDNDLVYTAVLGGVAGNRIKVSYTDPSAADESLAVTVTETAEGVFTNYVIDFSLATTAKVQSAYTTVLVGANNDLVFTATTAGTDGDDIDIIYVDPGVALASLSVVVDDEEITVNLATGAGGAITSTAAEVMAAVNEQLDSQKLVTVTNSGADTGAGVVTAMSKQDLASGSDGAVISTTADAIKAALLLDTDAAALVTAADSGGDDGTGAVIAMAATALTTGADNLVLDTSLIAV